MPFGISGKVARKCLFWNGFPNPNMCKGASFSVLVLGRAFVKGVALCFCFAFVWAFDPRYFLHLPVAIQQGNII